MKEDIIARFNLKLVEYYHFGQTLINNIKVYQYKDSLFLAACNSLGEPHPRGYIMVWVNDLTRHGYVTPEFLDDLPESEMSAWADIVNKKARYF